MEETESDKLSAFAFNNIQLRQDLGHTARPKLGNVFVIKRIEKVEKLVYARFYS